MKRHQAKRGFVLIEWMVQFLLLVILSVLAYTLIITWYKTMLDTNRLIANLLPVYLATDLIRSDMAQANPEAIALEENKLKVMREHKQILWHLNEHKLFRISGSYDERQNRWRKPAKSLVAKKLTGSFNKRHQDGQLEITLQSTQQAKVIKQIIHVRNGSVI